MFFDDVVRRVDYILAWEVPEKKSFDHVHLYIEIVISKPVTTISILQGLSQPTDSLGPLSTSQLNTISMAFY